MLVSGSVLGNVFTILTSCSEKPIPAHTDKSIDVDIDAGAAIGTG